MLETEEPCAVEKLPGGSLPGKVELRGDMGPGGCIALLLASAKTPPLILIIFLSTVWGENVRSLFLAA